MRWGPLKRARGIGAHPTARARRWRRARCCFTTGKGKWYPGEPLPRWALSCYWRADGVPVWEDVELIAREDQDYGLARHDAYRFMEALTRRFQVSTENVLPAYNPTPRRRAGGYILPIRRRQPGGRLAWSSQLWFPRPERLVLLGGRFADRLRIPTEAMPWVAPDELEYEV
jgi:uncharacterized protein (DUF2126 family)